MIKMGNYAMARMPIQVMEHEHGFLWYTLFVIVFLLSMWLMMKATKTLPLGTAYAVWTGIGAVGSVVMGMIFFKEPITLWRVVFLFTLISSIIGLKLTN